MSPIATAAARFPWDQFVTLTYNEASSVVLTETIQGYKIRRSMLFQFIRKIEDSFKIPEGFMPGIAREEKGESGGRFHWHMFVGGLHHVPGRGVIPSPNPHSDRHRLQALWAQCGKSAGNSWIRPYCEQLSGVQYILKGLDGYTWSNAGANAYELAKFDDSQADREVILTPSFVRHLQKKSRNRSHRKAPLEKVQLGDRSTRKGSETIARASTFPHPADHSEKFRTVKRKRYKDWSWDPRHAG